MLCIRDAANIEKKVKKTRQAKAGARAAAEIQIASETPSKSTKAHKQDQIVLRSLYATKALTRTCSDACLP